MAGFLDKNTRVIDMVLTDYGKELYSKGELEFSYFTFSDDEVDYDPWIYNSGSLSDTELTASKLEHVENSLVREATFGVGLDSGPAARDLSNINNLLFTMPQGQKVLPRMSVSPDFLTGSINAVQQKVERTGIVRDQYGTVIDKSGPFHMGYRKFKSTRVTFEGRVDDFFEKSAQEGFLVRVFHSGTSGLFEIDERYDIENVVSYANDLRLLLDEQADQSTDVDPARFSTLTNVRPVEKK